ncbi:hypothetical protein D9M68_217700 [compost metagenome]
MMRGFTLIEMLVVLALLGAFAMLAVPFASGWTARARLNVAESTWQEAYGRAKAAALRNRHGIHGAQAASVLCVSGPALEVRVASSPTSAASCASVRQWRATLPDGLESRHAGAAVSCFAFDNRGSLLALGSCSATAELELRHGTSHASIALR